MSIFAVIQITFRLSNGLNEAGFYEEPPLIPREKERTKMVVARNALMSGFPLAEVDKTSTCKWGRRTIDEAPNQPKLNLQLWYEGKFGPRDTGRSSVGMVV